MKITINIYVLILLFTVSIRSMASANSFPPDSLNVLLELAFERNVILGDTVIHPLRLLGERAMTEPYVEKNNTGIENKAEQDLKTAAMALVTAIPASIAQDFKVYDYSAYSLIGRFQEPEKWNNWVFNAMDSLIRTKYNVQYYLLIGKEIDPSNGKVKFRVKLNLPTVASTPLKPTTTAERSAAKDYKDGDIEQLYDDLENEIKILKVEKGDNIDDIGNVQKGIIDYIIKWTKEIQNRKYEWDGWYVMPSGDYIWIDCSTVGVNTDYSGVLYAWYERKDGKYYKYEAEIENQIFHGYRKYEINEASNTKAITSKYYTEVPTSLTVAGDTKVKFLNFTSTCAVDVFENTKNLIQKTRTLNDADAPVSWAITNIQAIKDDNFKQQFAIAINVVTGTCSKANNAIATEIYSTEGPKIANTSTATKEKALVFCNLLSNLDEDLRQDFWNVDKNNKLTILESEISKFFFDFKVPRDEAAYDKAINFLNNYLENIKKFQLACLTKNTNPDDFYKDNFFKFFFLTNNFILKGPFIKLSIDERVSLLKHELDRVYVNGAASDNYCNPEEMVMMAVQTTPQAQQSSLLTKLKTETIGAATNPKPLITSIFQKMDGLNAWQLNKTSEALLDFWHKNDANYLKYKKFIDGQGTATDQSDVITANEIAQNGFLTYYNPDDIPSRGSYSSTSWDKIQFTNVYTKLDASKMLPAVINNSTGEITPPKPAAPTLLNKKNLPLCEEYQIILLVPFKTFKFGDKEFKEGNTYAIPAFYYYTMLNERQSETTVQNLMIAVEIGSYAVGIGELAAAVRVGKGLKMAKAIFDIAIQVPGTVMTVAPNSTFWQENPNFTKAYTIFSLLYGGGQIAGAGLAKFRSQTDDLIDLIDTELAAAKADLAQGKAGAQERVTHWDELATACKNGKCFTAGTPIAVKEGFKPIEKVKENDLVNSWDFEKNTSTLQRVVRTFKRTTNQLVHLFIGKDTIHTTPEHPFFVPQEQQLYASAENNKVLSFGKAENGSWVLAKNLRKGAKVFLCSTFLATVDSSYTQDTVCTVYNFEVEKTHNYFVGKERVLVHNICDENIENILLEYINNKTNKYFTQVFYNNDNIISLTKMEAKSEKMILDLKKKILDNGNIDINGRNFGMIEINGIEDLDVDYIIGFSGTNSYGVVDKVTDLNPNIKNAIEVSPSPSNSFSHFNCDFTGAKTGPIIRSHDFERKGLDMVAKKLRAKLGNQAGTQKFTITITSELFPCASCVQVIQEFSNEFKGARIHIVARDKGLIKAF